MKIDGVTNRETAICVMEWIYFNLLISKSELMSIFKPVKEGVEI